jgi:hypothetical protein
MHQSAAKKPRKVLEVSQVVVVGGKKKKGYNGRV